VGTLQALQPFLIMTNSSYHEVDGFPLLPNLPILEIILWSASMREENLSWRQTILAFLERRLSSIASGGKGYVEMVRLKKGESAPK
jgi:hypothetical protein